MGLLGFLKGDQATDLATTDDLLRQALNDPAMLPEFYRALLAEDLLIATDADTFAEDQTIAAEDTYFKLRVYEKGALGIFTSAERLDDNKAVRGGDLQFLIFPGRIALMKTRGHRVIINPYSEYNIMLEPEEIDELLRANLYVGNRNLALKEPNISQNR